MVFSEPVDRKTIEINLAKRRMDIEGHLLPFCEPGQMKDCAPLVAGPCSPQGGCPGGNLVLSEDLTQFSLDPDEDLLIDKYVLRISAGLQDQQGNSTGVPIDLLFFASPVGTAGPTTFQPGLILTWMELDRPFDFPLEVYWHIRVDPDTGRIFGGGCDGDANDPDGERIYDHELWHPVPYLEEEGFKLVFDGLVQDAQVQDAEGNLVDGYILTTNPFYIYCAQPQVEVMDGIVTMSIYTDQRTGRQVANGTLTSDETYIFDTPAHSHPQLASGIVEGYRLVGAEVQTDKIWTDCGDLETVTRP
ncbi:MAG: hypothetical protein JRJ19_16015 [Deltaproteobacteria bacterium]|nr:hypothetical protein [Deltaproteobacteria bacterium]